MHRFVTLFLAFLTVSSAFASPASLKEARLGKRCVTTINSPSDVTPNALACTTININSFTMTAGKTLALTGLANGTTINLLGDVTFGVHYWAGPLMSITTGAVDNIFTFNGHGHTLNGQGEKYWDGKGSGGGVTKPITMLYIGAGGGVFEDVRILNSPAHAFTVQTSTAMTVTGVTVDNSAGDSLGRNTDCFNVGASDVTITGNTCMNQDDCIGILYGSNILFSNNTCHGGHGASIGSIGTGKVVKDVTISDNTITASANGLRIKTVYGATSASVTNIIYSNNRATGITQYGVIIEQDYANGGPSGKASNGVVLGPVTFEGQNEISVNSRAKRVYIICGTKCTGEWNLSGLTVTGGTSGSSNYGDVTGYTI